MVWWRAVHLLPVNEHPQYSAKRGSWNRHRSSIACVLAIGKEVCYGSQNPVTEDALAPGGCIRPFGGLGAWGLGDDSAEDAVSFAHDYDFTVVEPFGDLASIAELAEIDGRHGINVTQNVSQCQCRRGGNMDKESG